MTILPAAASLCRATETTVRDAVLSLLRDLGITRIFGNPGSTELPMFKDFPPDFHYILGLQESIVLAMADGYAQATRNAAMVNLHSSAGTGHALGNLFTAYKNQTPLIITAGQQARSILPFEPFLYAERPTEFPRPFVKWACEPARAADVPQALARAYYVAMTPPCGPTFVSIPVDDWEQPCTPVAPRRIATCNPGDPATLDSLAHDLAAAQQPALVLGAGCARDQAWDVAIRLAERQGLPVYVAPFASRNVFPENHALFRGFLSANRAAIANVLTRHDLVVAIGGPLNLYHTEDDGPHMPPGTAVWLITDDPNLLALAPTGTAILANARAAMERLTQYLPGRSPASGATQPPSSVLTITRGGLGEEQMLDRIAALRPARSIIVEEAPSTRPAMQRRLPILREDGFYTTAGGGLGFGLPAAVGIALGRPGERVIALLGDGSTMYAVQGLHAAVRERANVSFLIVNNRRYEALKQFGRHFGIDPVEGADLDGLDFCSLARGLGMAARRVETVAELDAGLEWSFRTAGPSLVEMVVS